MGNNLELFRLYCTFVSMSRYRIVRNVKRNGNVFYSVGNKIGWSWKIICTDFESVEEADIYIIIRKIEEEKRKGEEIVKTTLVKQYD